MLRKSLYALALLALGPWSCAYAVEAKLTVEIPRLQVAEYHRPYVAVWVRDEASGAVTNLIVWYQMDDKGEGEKWLKDLRQWWRRSGRTLTMPVDAFSGATRRPGTHVSDVSAQMATLSPGEYTLYVEASREVGGRELLTLDFTWPTTKPLVLKTQGDSELGAIGFDVQP